MKSAMEMEYNALAAFALENQYKMQKVMVERKGEYLQAAYDAEDLERAKRLEYSLRENEADLNKLLQAITHFRKGPEQ